MSEASSSSSIRIMLFRCIMFHGSGAVVSTHSMLDSTQRRFQVDVIRCPIFPCDWRSFPVFTNFFYIVHTLYKCRLIFKMSFSYCIFTSFQDVAPESIGIPISTIATNAPQLPVSPARGLPFLAPPNPPIRMDSTACTRNTHMIHM
jgi:hypothetical protein